MPRVSLKKIEYQLFDLSCYILGDMRAKGITQTDMAAVLGMTQGNLSQKLKSCTLTVEELIQIFEKLGTSPEKIGTLLKGDHNGRN